MRFKRFIIIIYAFASFNSVGGQQSEMYDFENNPVEIFKPGKEFIYVLDLDVDSVKFECDLIDGPVPLGTANQRIDSIGVFVNGLDFYGQIKIEYKQYVDGVFYSDQRSFSGAIENDSLIWMHPYRQSWFRTLNLSPYPQYSKYWENAYFTDSLIVGGKYLMNTKVEGQSPILVLRKYQAEKSPNLIYIHSTSTSEAGTSSLETTLDKSVGFLKMDYTTVDGTRIFFTLKNIKTTAL